MGMICYIHVIDYFSSLFMPDKHKRKTCDRCKRPLQQCYCHTIAQVDNRWPIHILQHAKEERHPLGTARIAALSLSLCQLHRESEIDFDSVIAKQGAAPLLVYPGSDAVGIDEIEQDRPRPLLFIDASWRKSRRMFYDYPFLNKLEKISFEPSQTSRYRVRKPPRTDYLSTLESIVFVLSTLEGDVEKYLPLLNSMDHLIETQIACMGEELFSRNYTDQKDN